VALIAKLCLDLLMLPGMRRQPVHAVTAISMVVRQSMQQMCSAWGAL